MNVRIILLGFLLALPLSTLQAGDAEESTDNLLRRSADFYAGLDAVAFEVTVVPEMPADSPMAGFEIPPIHYRVAAARPNLVALRASDTAMETTFVQDGTRQYSKIPFVRSYVLEQRNESIAELIATEDRMMIPGAELMLGLAFAAQIDPFAGAVARRAGIETLDGIECQRLHLSGKHRGEVWIARGGTPWVVRFLEAPPEDPLVEPVHDDEVGFSFRPRMDFRFSGFSTEVDLDTAFAIELPVGFDQEDSVADALLKLDGGMMGLTEEPPGTEQAIPAPAVNLTPIGGQPFALADLRGRVVVLDFWATWCKPCVVDLPAVLEVVNEFSADQVALWTVNRFESDETIEDFMREEGLEFDVSTDRDNSIAEAFKVMAIPQVVVIDRDGVIRHVHVGMTPGGKPSLKKEIEALLGG